MLQANHLISVVDDDPSMSRMLCRAIKAAGLSVDAFGSAEEFLDSEASRASVCVILDMNLPGMNGLELQQLLNASRVEVPIIFMSAQADEATQLRALEAMGIGNVCCVFGLETTPTPPDEIERRMQRFATEVMPALR